MSRIDDLMAELTSSGVHEACMGEIGRFIRGRRFTKDDIVSDGIPSIHYGEIYTHYGVAATSALSHVRRDLEDRLRFAKQGDVVIAAVGETVEDVAKAVAWLGAEPVAIHDDTFLYRSALDPKFVSYFMRTKGFHAQKNKYVARAKVKRLSGEGLAKIRIPVPPLRVQAEIVEVLDHLTELKEELEVGLKAELEARRRQYAFYKESLLTFCEADEVRRIPMGDLGTWYGGGTPSKAVREYWTEATIPWLSPKDMGVDTVMSTEDRVAEIALERTALKLVPPGSIAFVVRSNILRRHLPIAFVPISVTLNQDMRALIPSDDILPAYVAQVCQARQEEILAIAGRTDGSMAAIQSKKLMAYRIPVPPLAEQKRIVAILDKFDALVKGLSADLFTELVSRRRQYEYYRDRLLTFEEAAA
ncbi:restriction endonuclease subunit S [Micromonospora carbonacea]|uniref:restriction endonuclease subunit S n=1 Tax=Micromonospora carbonacea TaxID=47853 RepID=UPI003720AEC9